jgi:hypothetical protein
MKKCFRQKCEFRDKDYESGCSLYPNPSKAMCTTFVPRPSNRKKQVLNKCACGRYPEILKGRHLTLERATYAVQCTNPRCKSKPGTEACLVLRKAKSLWNQGTVTEGLF